MKRDPTRYGAGTESLQRRAQDLSDVAHFARRIVHDFNNIFGTALGNLELAQMALKEKADGLAYLAKVERALVRGVGLTEELLLFAADQSEEPIGMDPGAVIQGLQAKIIAALPLGSVLDLCIAESLCDVETDRDEFEAVVIKLVENACDAMGERGKLRISCENKMVGDCELLRRWRLPPGPYVDVSVADNGTGMPEEVRGRAFEPFFSTKERKDRRGLGLSIVYGFADRQQGCVEIASESGSGTCVSLFLPCRAVEDR